MSNENYRAVFASAAKEWLCDPYGVDVRFLHLGDSSREGLVEAAIVLLAQQTARPRRRSAIQ